MSKTSIILVFIFKESRRNVRDTLLLKGWFMGHRDERIRTHISICIYGYYAYDIGSDINHCRDMHLAWDTQSIDTWLIILMILLNETRSFTRKDSFTKINVFTLTAFDVRNEQQQQEKENISTRITDHCNHILCHGKKPLARLVWHHLANTRKQQ